MEISEDKKYNKIVHIKIFNIENQNYSELIAGHFGKPRFSLYKIYVGRNKLHIRGVRSLARRKRRAKVFPLNGYRMGYKKLWYRRIFRAFGRTPRLTLTAIVCGKWQAKRSCKILLIVFESVDSRSRWIYSSDIRCGSRGFYLGLCMFWIVLVQYS